MTEKIRALVKGGTLSEQLIAVRKRIAVIDAETVRTDGELERLALPALRGDGEAVAATGELEQRKQTLAAEREALRRAEGQLHSGVTAEASVNLSESSSASLNRMGRRFRVCIQLS